MTLERKKNEWEVELQKPDGTTMIEKVAVYWSKEFEGIKEAIAHAARSNAWRRNKGKVEFQVKGEPKFIGQVS